MGLEPAGVRDPQAMASGTSYCGLPCLTFLIYKITSSPSFLALTKQRQNANVVQGLPWPEGPTRPPGSGVTQTARIWPRVTQGPETQPWHRHLRPSSDPCGPGMELFLSVAMWVLMGITHVPAKKLAAAATLNVKSLLQFPQQGWTIGLHRSDIPPLQWPSLGPQAQIPST